MLWLLACAVPEPVVSVPFGGLKTGGPGELSSWTVTVQSLAPLTEFPWSGSWSGGELEPDAVRTAEVRAPLGHSVSLLFQDEDALAYVTLPLFDGREASPGTWTGGWKIVSEGSLQDVDALIGLEEFIAVEVVVDSPWTFTLTVTNVSDEPVLGPGVMVVHSDDHPLLVDEQLGLEELQAGDVSSIAADLESRTGLFSMIGPGVWVLHDADQPLFEEGGAASPGLEVLAEDGSPLPLAQALINEGYEVGVFGPGDATDGYHPILPGEASDFRFEAAGGTKLSIASMFIQSNDLFMAPQGAGVVLEERDVSDQLAYWDAGTEVNQEPGFGPDQGPRQHAANTGDADGDVAVRLANDGYVYPELTDILRVSIVED